MIKLRVTDVKQYVYCPRIIYFTYVCPVEKRVTRKMAYGKEEHLELDRLEKRRNFKRFGLDHGKRVFHQYLRSERLGLEGRLDMHVIANGEYFPVEFKHTVKGPSLNHKYQLVSYAMLLEDFYNKPVRYGFLYLIPEKKPYPIEINTNARIFVKECLDKIRDIIVGEKMPRPNRFKGCCKDCEYRNFCGDVN
ncbi:CRISPR-associated protein Cas4 [Desulfotruncus alcoholivorax]|uniref:CRISPR-associated protein Cas4 n=1 Tax=Desulfotruncus alcoholivorax TaxID=265477 RepID=UPI00041C0C67|nr:CRISPR-associated protein Cas4 [Desulfotruncus alcoholivorax]